MTLLSFTALLALGAPPAGTNVNPTGAMVTQLGMFAILGVIFYMLMIRPQQKKAKEHAAMLNTLRAGDKVIASGGIVGIVVGVKDKSVSIRSADTKIEVLKSSVSEVTERGSAES